MGHECSKQAAGYGVATGSCVLTRLPTLHVTMSKDFLGHYSLETVVLQLLVFS